MLGETAALHGGAEKGPFRCDRGAELNKGGSWCGGPEVAACGGQKLGCSSTVRNPAGRCPGPSFSAGTGLPPRGQFGNKWRRFQLLH